MTSIMTRYNFSDSEKDVLIPLIEKRYISVYETFDMPRPKDMEAINELKEEFIEEKDEDEIEGVLLGKNSRTVLCSIILQEIITPNAELMSDIKEMTKEEIEGMAVEYKEIISFVKHYKALRNKLYPFKKNKKFV